MIPDDAAPVSVDVVAGTNTFTRTFYNLPPTPTLGKYRRGIQRGLGRGRVSTTTLSNAVTMLAPMPVSIPILMYHGVCGPRRFRPIPTP